MLTIIVAKLLLKGAIKTFVVKPVISSSVTVIPSPALIQATMAGKSVTITISDLIKFGVEKLYEKFGERKLDFQIQKLGRHIYGVSPAEELAAIFAKEYADDQEILVDLSKFESYLDAIISEYETNIEGLQEAIIEKDEVLMQTLHDLEVAIEMSQPHTFITPADESKLIDEILDKNLKMVESKLKERRTPQTAVDEILADFPAVPYTPTTDAELIEAILSKFSPKDTKKSKTKLKL